MAVVMKCIEWATGDACEFEGQYFKRFDPFAHNGVGDAVWTPNIDEAARFADQLEAIKVYHSIPRCHPVRLTDGKPNKPITAYTVLIEEA
jgi:hypothetical protein